MAEALLAYDVASIRRFVFATGRLREIRGASALLDDTNRNRLQEAAKLVDGNLSVIYEGGGSGLYRTESSKIPDIEAALHSSLTSATCSARLQTAWVLMEADFRAAFSKLLARLRIAKNRNPPFIGAPSHAFLRTCDACGEHYASERDPKIDDRRICRSCHLKIRKSDELTDSKAWPGFWQDIRSELPEINHFRRPEQLDDLCPSGTEMALIYADGDGLGKLFEQCESVEEVRDKSKRVQHGLGSALANALKPVLTAHGSSRNSEKEGKPWLPFDIFLLGGDDLILAIQARYAFELAITLVEQFRDKTIDIVLPEGRRTSLSVGVAIAHAHYPVRDLVHLAKGALAHAKRERYRRRVAKCQDQPGMISHVRVDSLSHTDYDAYAKDELLCDASNCPAQRTLRPYTTEELRALMTLARQMRKDPPRTKLQALRGTAFLTHNQAVFDALSAMLRVSPEKTTRIVHEGLSGLIGCEKFDFPFTRRDGRFVNPWLDIADLADYAGVATDDTQ